MRQSILCAVCALTIFGLLLMPVVAAGECGDGGPAGIGPMERVEIALDGRSPRSIARLAWRALRQRADVAGAMPAFTWTMAVAYHDEGDEPTLEVCFRRRTAPFDRYTVGLSIGLFEPVYSR